MKFKVGDYITINKTEADKVYETSGYTCGSSRPGIHKCGTCDFYKGKPCKIIRVSEKQIRIELNVNCGTFFGEEKRFSEHFKLAQRYKWEDL